MQLELASLVWAFSTLLQGDGASPEHRGQAAEVVRRALATLDGAAGLRERKPNPKRRMRRLLELVQANATVAWTMWISESVADRTLSARELHALLSPAIGAKRIQRLLNGPFSPARAERGAPGDGRVVRYRLNDAFHNLVEALGADGPRTGPFEGAAPSWFHSPQIKADEELAASLKDLFSEKEYVRRGLDQVRSLSRVPERLEARFLGAAQRDLLDSSKRAMKGLRDAIDGVTPTSYSGELVTLLLSGLPSALRLAPPTPDSEKPANTSFPVLSRTGGSQK